MLDDSFCCLRSLIFGEKIRLEFANVRGCLKLIRFCDLVEGSYMYMHTVVYACGCICNMSSG